MDIFVKNVPQHCSFNQLREFLKKPLAASDIHTFTCNKPKGKPFAFITVLEAELGRNFLNHHSNNFRKESQLVFHGSTLRFLPGTKVPDEFVLKGLVEENIHRKQRATHKSKLPAVAGSRLFSFPIVSLHCGFWDYRQGSLTFFPSYSDSRQGSFILGRKSLVIILKPNDREPKEIRLDIPYDSVNGIFTGTRQLPSVTLNLLQAPSFYVSEIDLSGAMNNLSLTPGGGFAQQQNKKSRVCNLGTAHSSSAGSCLVYRFQLIDAAGIDDITKHLAVTHGAPSHLSWQTTMRVSTQNVDTNTRKLEDHLQANFSLPWTISFQLQKLATNGILPPAKVLQLLPHIQAMTRIASIRESSIAEGIRNLSRTLPYPGPEQNASVYSPEALGAAIKHYATEEFEYYGSMYEIVHRHSQLALIHHVNVTPTGTWLEGPSLETKNRVLRQYLEHTDYFLRVDFSDEDGGPVRTDPGTSRYSIFERFRDVMNGSIKVAGRMYTFLGFSHSSLRARQCWFMAPFIENGELVHAKEVIRRLGDFAKIKSPAKCAARIGQTFSDANDTIKVQSDTTVIQMPDVKRNGYCFTDGVGTISQDLLLDVWMEFTRTRRHNATLLQIRYGGAKGMLVLDSRLTGKKLCLRDSMVKFDSEDSNLEICGAAFKPLPCYLNRQFIKIFEDLGVPDEAFLELQQQAVKMLELMTKSPVNAANFLEMQTIGSAARVSSLIRMLDNLGLNFQHDQFLRQIVEVAASVSLRDIKHRGRIPLPKAYTLYGVADETGVLLENQVHVIIQNKLGHREVVVGPVIITRAPALHPGDIRVVDGVAIPLRSMNIHLNNCVIFSQQGKRDLPNQLSGGDLDGDLFNVILDETLWPKKISTPAEYLRQEAIDIGRPVDTRDMTDFFVTFMETDQLGYISNSHMQAADQCKEGTFSAPCLQLAAMASTAVDYSKTGIAVDMKLFPKGFQTSAKPDFMAHAPRLIVDAEGVNLEEIDPLEHEDFDAVHALDPDRRRPLYYRSTKILGKLYRAIDETQFVKNMHSHLTPNNTPEGSQTLLTQIWAHVKQRVAYIQWNHLVPMAREIRSSYEDMLADVMHQYSPHHRLPLSELEVISGTILGRLGGLPNKRTRDMAASMKSDFERRATFHVNWIQHGEVADENDSVTDYEGQTETLERSIACLAIAVLEEGRFVYGVGNLRSFAYVAAAVCLKEVADLGSYGAI